VADGTHVLRMEAFAVGRTPWSVSDPPVALGSELSPSHLDEIRIRVSQNGRHQQVPILGTQFGPNNNGRHWPRRREQVTR
jgi:hypothetical protein